MKNSAKLRIKRICLFVLLISCLCMSFQCVSATGEVSEYNVAEYKGNRPESDWIVPTRKGMVFAGWYTDENFETPYKQTTGTAVPKFVDASVLSVKKQLNSGASITSNSISIRFLTSVDTLRFNNVGFEVNVDSNPVRQFDLRETKAYASIIVDGKTEPVTPANAFGTAEATYFILHSITGIPKAFFGETFTVKPYWTTVDGTKVYGTTDVFSINSLLSSPADVWYTSGTQKIRPDVDAAEYSGVQLSGLNLKSGKAEYESAQIIMSANADINDFDLIASDLTLAGNPSVKFSADNISSYVEGYIYCDNIYETSSLSTKGAYPDALIPLSAAKKYGENKAYKGRNQGIWVTFNVPKEQQAGEYTGTFILEMDGYRQEVPVNLKVWDFDYADNYTAKNCFLIDWTSFSFAELDTSQDIYNAYAKALLEYRLQPDMIMNDFLQSKTEDIAYYTQQAFELAQDERCTAVFMPYEYHNRGGSDTNLDEAGTKKWIRAFVDASLNSYGTEKQLNLVGKTYVYFTICDETHVNAGLIPRANRLTADLSRFRTEVKQEYLSALASTSGLSQDEYNFRLEVINSIDNISHVLVGEKDDRLEGVEVYCPPLQDYNDANKRNQYVNDKERWWYTCVGPNYPYPTYHIDDTNGLLSARVMSWMQADYDIIGNLYWAANLYNAYSKEEFLENPYIEIANRYSGANGDGYLFYPGKKYGFNGPIGTVRLHSIRDGLEEFESLQRVKSLYKNIGIDFQSVYSQLAGNVYSGAQVGADQTNFDVAREQIANMAELATIGCGISKVSLSYFSNSEVQLAVPNGCTVTYNGSASVSTQQNGNYTYYSFKRTLGLFDLSTFNCVVSNGNKSVEVNLYLRGSKSDYMNTTFKGVNRYLTDKTVSTTATATHNYQSATIANMQNLSGVASSTDILLYDFEDYSRNFQLLKTMSYFGAVSENVDERYIKNGHSSALLQPLGFSSTMLNNPNWKKPESCLYLPFTSTTYQFNYSNSARINKITFSIYNSENENISVYVGLVYDKHVQEVFTPERFVLKPGWNEIEYTVNHNAIALNYNLAECFGMALSFDRVNSRELKDAPKLYLDDVWLKLNSTDVVAQDIVSLDSGEVCDFEKDYQKYVVKAETYDKARRPDMQIVSASDYGLTAPSGQKVLRAVLKPVDCIDGTIYDSIYLTESLMKRFDFGTAEDEKVLSFDIYNSNSEALDLAISFHRKTSTDYRLYGCRALPNQWTHVVVTALDMGEEYLNDPGAIYIHYSEFYGNEIPIYLDNFRIEQRQVVQNSYYVDFGNQYYWKAHFATVDGQSLSSYVTTATVGNNTINNAIHFQANGQWPTIAGFKPAYNKSYYEQFRGEKFLIEMYVNGYSSQWGEGFYPKLYAKYPGNESVIATINKQGKYSISLDPAIILDNWDSFVNGTAMFYFDDGGGTVSIDCYFTGMYFTFETTSYVDFTDSQNWQSRFATVNGQSNCSYAASATVGSETVKNAIHFQANGQWPTIAGFNPLCVKDYCEQFRDGKFFIEMYVNDYSSQWGEGYYPELYVKVNGVSTVIQEINRTGKYIIKVPASTILDSWDSFANGTSMFYFDDGGGNVSIDCYFTKMYFSSETNDFIDFTDSQNWQSKFATLNGQSNCSYAASATIGTETVNNAIRYQASGQWPAIAGFKPAIAKEYGEQFEDGKFYIEMYVNSFSSPYQYSGSYPKMYIKYAGHEYPVVVIDHQGKYVIKLDPSVILDNWNSFVNGTAMFYFDDGGAEISIDCYFTKMYFAIETSKYVDFTDSTQWKSNFATAIGQSSCSYVELATVGARKVNNAIHYQGSGQWPTFAGFKPINRVETYEKYRDGKFIIEMYVASYSSQWGDGYYPKFYIKPNGVDTQIQRIDHVGSYSVEVPAATILDNWDSFVNGSSMFYFDDGGGNVSVDCYFTAMYFENSTVADTPDYVEFSDAVNWKSNFATATGQSSCSYIASATVGTETVNNAIRVQASGQWPTFAGFNPSEGKANYEQYRNGKFIIEMQVASYSSEWGAGYYPKLYIKSNGADKQIQVIDHVGSYSIELPAVTILDNWRSFANGSSTFYFDDGGGNVTVDCYFTRMYFEKDPIPPNPNYIDFTDSANWWFNFATAIGQNNCSYVESATLGTETITNAIRFRQNGEWLNIGGFNAINPKELYEVYRGGKFVIDMYVADNYSQWGAGYYPKLYFKTSTDTLVGTLNRTGKMSFVMDAATILDNWGAFIFYFADGGGEVHVDCYFTGMYFEMPTTTFMDFTDSTNWQNHFATTNGQQYCSYVESTTVGSDTIENAVRYTASNPESIWLTGITAINHKESYEQYRGGKFVIDMYVASYTGNNPMLNVVVTWPPVERSLVLGHQRIEVDASLVLDSNVNFSLQVWNCDSIDCYITGMYFTEQ